MMVVQFVVSLMATLSFAVLFSAPKKELFFCGLTGAVGWIVYLIFLDHNASIPIANLIATFALTLISRVIASVRKNPVTLYLITGIFPIVPGAGIYYTSYYFIMNDMEQFSNYGMQTIKVAGAIVLGTVFGFALPQAWFNALGTRRDLRRELPAFRIHLPEFYLKRLKIAPDLPVHLRACRHRKISLLILFCI